MTLMLGIKKLDNPPGNFKDSFKNTSTSSSEYAFALFKIFWAFDGWNNLNYAVGELRDPVKNLPRAGFYYNFKLVLEFL